MDEHRTPAAEDDLWSGMAMERTALAWNRTSLALAAAGATILKGFKNLQSGTARDILGFLLLGSAAFVWLLGWTRYRKVAAEIETGSTIISERLIRLVAVASSLVAVVALVLALLPTIEGR